jgi:hypothetical protein
MIIRIQRALNEFVKDMIFSILKPFNHIRGFEERMLEECRTLEKKKLSQILGYSIGKSFQSIERLANDFNTCWQSNLMPIFLDMKIIQRDNSYLKRFIAVILCNEEFDLNFHFPIIKENLLTLGNEIFGDVKNFRFIKKACSIIHHLENSQSHIPNLKVIHPIELKVSRISSTISNPNQILRNEQSFKIIPTGLEDSHRRDRLVFFGNHRFCDIQLPDESKFDKIAFVIYHNEDHYQIMDCSKKCELKRKLFGDEEVKVTGGMLVDLAEASLINFCGSIVNENQETGDVEGVATYEFLKGELANPMGDRHRYLIGTVGSDVVFGKGMFQERVDVILNERGTISSKHLTFKCEGEFWTVRDLGSSNGTFVYFKNYGQFNEKTFSTPSLLLPVIEYGGKASESATIKISGIVFFIKLLG